MRRTHGRAAEPVSLRTWCCRSNQRVMPGRPAAAAGRRIHEGDRSRRCRYQGACRAHVRCRLTAARQCAAARAANPIDQRTNDRNRARTSCNEAQLSIRQNAQLCHDTSPDKQLCCNFEVMRSHAQLTRGIFRASGATPPPPAGREAAARPGRYRLPSNGACRRRRSGPRRRSRPPRRSERPRRCGRI